MAYHFSQIRLRGAPAALQSLVRSGDAGVSLFFVLSGFILLHVYAGAESLDRLPARSFWRNRFARIYPTYLAALVFAFPLFAGRDGVGAADLPALVSTPILTQAWYTPAYCSWNCPGWSLSAEAFFYSLFPIFLIWISQMGVRRLYGLVTICGAISIAIPALADVSIATHLVGSSQAALLTSAAKTIPLLRLPEFMIGIAAGRLWHLGAVPRVTAGWIALMLVAVAAFGESAAGTPLHAGGLAIGFALLICALADGTGWFARLLATWPMQRLGEASYALYLFHFTLHGYFDRALQRVGVNIDLSAPWIAIYMATAIALSLGVNRYIEEPARRWLRARGKPERQLAEADAVPAPQEIAS